MTHNTEDYSINRNRYKVVDQLLSAGEARHYWKTSGAWNPDEVDAALLDVHRCIEHESARGEDDAVIRDWRKLVPDALTRKIVIRTLEDLDYKVIKDHSRLIIEWKRACSSDESDDE